MRKPNTPRGTAQFAKLTATEQFSSHANNTVRIEKCSMK